MQTNKKIWAVAGATLLIGACSTTQKQEISHADVKCALVNDVCARLVPGENDEQAGLKYINPNANWARYQKVMIEPVTFWGDQNTDLAETDQQALVDFFSQELNKTMAEKFEVVSQPGPDVMKIAVALTDSEAATPVLRSLTMIVPQARVLSTLKYLATDTFPFIGSAQAEAKVKDSVTGEVLGAFIDKRVGGGAVRSGFQWKWGDAENAIKHWSEFSAERLAELTQGSTDK